MNSFKDKYIRYINMTSAEPSEKLINDTIKLSLEKEKLQNSKLHNDDEKLNINMTVNHQETILVEQNKTYFNFKQYGLVACACLCVVVAINLWKVSGNYNHTQEDTETTITTITTMLDNNFDKITETTLSTETSITSTSVSSLPSNDVDANVDSVEIKSNVTNEYAYIESTANDEVTTMITTMPPTDITTTEDEIETTTTTSNVVENTVWDGSADTSWYNDTDTEFTLTTAEQLSGLAKLVNEGNNFEGKTINLGSDIVLNDGIFSKSSDGVYQYNGIDIPEDEMQNYWTNDTYYEKNTYMKYLTDSTTSVYENMPKVWTTIGCDANNFFSGTFNGNNHTVSGLYQNSLFGFVGHTDYPESSLALTSEDFSNSDYVVNISNVGVVNGLLSTPAIAYKLCGTLTNCYNTNDIYNPYISLSFIGGLVGENCGNIYDCYNTGNIDTSSAFNGGINGVSYSNTIVDNCYNTGNISGKINQPIEILNDFLVVTANGGITGYVSHNNIITNCTNFGEIFSRNDYLSDDNSGNKSYTFYDYSFNSPCAGGIVGACGGNNTIQKGLNTIINCYNNGNVIADAIENNNSKAYSGGIAGIINYCSIDSCTNNGNVSSMSIIKTPVANGIACDNSFTAKPNIITNCYNNGSVETYTQQLY